MSACSAPRNPSPHRAIRITTIPLELWMTRRSSAPATNPRRSDALSAVLMLVNHETCCIGIAAAFNCVSPKSKSPRPSIAPSSAASRGVARAICRCRIARPMVPISQSVARFMSIAARNASSAVPGFAHATTVSARCTVMSRAETRLATTKETAVALCPTAPNTMPRMTARGALATAASARRRIDREASAFRLDLIASSPMRKKTRPARKAGSTSHALIGPPSAAARAWVVERIEVARVASSRVA